MKILNTAAVFNCSKAGLLFITELPIFFIKFFFIYVLIFFKYVWCKY